MAKKCKIFVFDCCIPLNLRNFVVGGFLVDCQHRTNWVIDTTFR